MPSYNLDDYFERDSTGLERVLIRARRAFQGAEMNELQAILIDRFRRFGDALFRDGNVIRGADVVIDPDTGLTQVTAGTVYVRGDVRAVPAATLTIPVIGAVEIGIRLTETVITEMEDPSLLNPVPGAESYHAPGAARLRVDTVWGWRSGTTSDGQPGDFYAVSTVTNGVLDNKTPPPNLDGVSQALARYDRAQSGGTYVVTGLGMQGLSITDGQQVFSLAEGKAHVDGFEVEKPTATRLAFPADPDLLLIEQEPHAFVPDGTGKMRLNVFYAPLAEIAAVKITAERIDVQVVHGGYNGALDALPDLSVLQILAVKQGATTYTAGPDYKLTGNAVDWSPGGAEPATGSTYTVSYRYLTNGTVTGKDDRGITVAGAVSGTLVLVNYRTKLPRRDRLVLRRDGQIDRVRGVADLRSPAVPSAPAGTLPLATLLQDWFALPGIVVDAPKVIPVSELQALFSRVDALFDLVAVERLKTDVTAREPTGAKGVFVDPFFDNDMRDTGLAQTAAIVAGELMLPIQPIFPDPLLASSGEMLSFTLESVVEQTLATDSIKINPYDSFAPIPCKVTVITPVDRWTVDQLAWDTESVRFVRTGHFVEGVSHVTSTTVLSETIETVRSTTTEAQFLRQVPLIVRIEHLGPGERVPSIVFDGITIATNLVADAAGVVEHQFVIPAGIPAGTKKVEVTAAAAGTGVATFTGEGQVTTEVRRRVATVEEYHVDPVAQSIMLRQGRHIGGVDLLFRARGASSVVVQLRDMANGYPGRNILAEARLKPASIRTDGQPTRFTWSPVWMATDVEFCVVVLCDDADASLAIATLGEFDTAKQQWVTQQPYQIGVMFSSSNGTTWTPHQKSDLWFRLLAARFTATSKTVPLGSLTAAQVSDLVGLFNAERPAADTRITLRLIAQDGREFSLSDGQPLNLTDRLTGNVSVQLVLEGTDTRTPVVYPGVQAIFGVLSDSATYISRQFATPAASKLRLVIDVITPGNSTVTPEIQTAAGTWVTVPQSSATPIGDGWEERVHLLTGFNAATTRVRLTLNGSALNRPRVRRLRAIAA
ncbi:DUF4815 domain-containing protein (plasmid) [Azospirillum sp. HJ39]|uniref:DUF4815 domain-containing protein n=1 Tax=Azospirillum sp. HJ39 TaxID=3159496 RepID=UPI00355892AA